MSLISKHITSDFRGDNISIEDISKELNKTFKKIAKISEMKEEGLTVIHLLTNKPSLEGEYFANTLVTQLNKRSVKMNLPTIAVEDDGEKKDRSLAQKIYDWIKKLIRNIMTMIKKAVLWVLKLFSGVDQRYKDALFKVRELYDDEFEQGRNAVYKKYVEAKKFFWVTKEGKLFDNIGTLQKIMNYHGKKRMAFFDDKYGGFKLEPDGKVKFNIQGFFNLIKPLPGSQFIKLRVNTMSTAERFDESKAINGLIDASVNFFLESIPTDTPPDAPFAFSRTEMQTQLDYHKFDGEVKRALGELEKNLKEYETISKDLEKAKANVDDLTSKAALGIINGYQKSTTCDIQLLAEFSKYLTQLTNLAIEIYAEAKADK